jgi:hypothetical protein
MATFMTSSAWLHHFHEHQMLGALKDKIQHSSVERYTNLNKLNTLTWLACTSREGIGKTV